MNRVVLPAALVAVAFHVGCATLAPRGDLSVSLVNLVPTQTSLFETSAALTLRFTNAMAEPLALKGTSHRLYLNGTYVGQAVSDQPLTLPALGTTTTTMVVHLENLALFRKAAELSNAAAPVIGYRIDSRLFPAGGRGFTRSASTSGELDLSGFTGLADQRGAAAGVPVRSPPR